jgi:hypothetical protein
MAGRTVPVRVGPWLCPTSVLTEVIWQYTNVAASLAMDANVTSKALGPAEPSIAAVLRRTR